MNLIMAAAARIAPEGSEVKAERYQEFFQVCCGARQAG